MLVRFEQRGDYLIQVLLLGEDKSFNFDGQKCF